MVHSQAITCAEEHLGQAVGAAHCAAAIEQHDGEGQRVEHPGQSVARGVKVRDAPPGADGGLQMWHQRRQELALRRAEVEFVTAAEHTEPTHA